MVKKAWNKKGFVFLIIALLLLLYWVRVVNLDQDLPPWGVGLYQPKDEGCYAILAINRMEYGQINPTNPLLDEGAGSMYIQEHIRVDYLGNLLESLGFYFFGDTYFGLRFPMVVVGFCNLCLLFAVLMLLRKQYGRGETDELWVIAGLLLFTVTSFYYYLASRTVEPSAHRMLFAQLSFLTWLTLKDRRRLCFFLMGVLISASVFLVYLTNVFLYLSVLFLLIMIGRTEGVKSFFRCAAWFVLGVVPIFAAAELYYRIAWDSSLVSNMLGTLGVFKDSAGYAIEAQNGAGSFIKGAIKGAVKYLCANWFLYAPTQLFGVLLLIPPAVWAIVKKKDKTVCLMLAVPAAFLLQTMVTEDYIWRKLLVVAPFFLYLILWGFLRRAEFPAYSREWKDAMEKLRGRFFRALLRLIHKHYALLALLLSFLVLAYHLFLSDDLARQDFTRADDAMILLLGCLPAAVWLVYRQHRVRREKPASVAAAVCLLGCTAVVLNLGLLAKYVLLNPTYRERDMQISLSEVYGLDNRYVIGDSVMGITLYNDLKPVYDHHMNYGNRMISNPELLLFHYSDEEDPSLREYLDTVVFNARSEYSAKRICSIPETFQTFGKMRKFALYTVGSKYELIQEQRENMDARFEALLCALDELELNSNSMSMTALLEAREKIMNEIKDLEETALKKDVSAVDRESEYYGIIEPVTSDIFGNVYGSVYEPVFGRVFGNIYGDVKAPIYGDIYGDVYGNIYVDYSGTIHGTYYGDVIN